MSEPADERTPPPVVRALRDSRAEIALAVGSVVLLVAVALVTRRLPLNPFGDAVRYGTLGTGMGCAVVVAVVHWLRGARVAGHVGALLVSAWLVLFTASQLIGTPYGYGAVKADMGRLSALVTRFSVSTASTDQIVPGLPSEYPPLFPWVVGKTASITGIPAWRLLGPAALVLIGLSVVAAYLLWRRVVHPALALLLSIVPAAIYGDPRKAFEVLAASVLLPWVVQTFGRGRGGDGRPGLHWLSAGVVGGLLATDYPAYVWMSVLGLAALALVGLWRAPRWPYFRHLALTGIVAVIVSAWYVVPWLTRLVTDGGKAMADRFRPSVLETDPLHLPWQHAWPVAVLLTTGLLLLVWYARREAWARCLLAVALGVMVYRWLNLWRYHHSGHTGFLAKTGRLSDAALACGFLLGAAALWPVLRARLDPRGLRRLAGVVPSAALATALAVMLGMYWQANRIGRPLGGPEILDFAAEAHGTPLPDGKHPRYWARAPVHRRGFPAFEVRRIVESVYGRGALPVTLSYAEQISSYYPFFQYLGTGAYSASSLSFWPARMREVQALAGTIDPAAFAARSARLRFGQIDVFVLRRSHGELLWAHKVHFRPEQFGPRYFVHRTASLDTEVFVRRGATVRHADYPR